MIKHALGSQLAVELYGCDPGVLDDVEEVTRQMLGAADASGATVIGHRFHRFQPQGVSGVVIIAESHLAVHTWPEHRYAAVDVFTCGSTLLADHAVRHLCEGFRASGCEVTRVVRGVPRSQEPSPLRRAPRHPGLFRYDADFVSRFLVPALAAPRRRDARRLVTEVAEQVYLFPLFTEEFCRLLVEEVEHAAGWGGPDETTAESWVPLSGLAGAAAVYGELVRHHLQPLLEGLWSTYQLGRWEAPSVHRYAPAAEGARPREPRHGVESIALIGFLNGDFDGGGTHFPRWGATLGGSASVPVGSCLLYPGGVSHAHVDRPVAAGRRYTLTGSFG